MRLLGQEYERPSDMVKHILYEIIYQRVETLKCSINTKD